ncbi:MAG: TPM domain-containing protein [Porphyromonadaceae bacterium]|nr:TPM domain-containing protein [Porphyromonadaceae bacterium]
MIRQKVTWILWLLLFSGNLLRAAEYKVEEVPNLQRTDERRFVTNPDGIIGVAAEASINARLYTLRQNTTAEIAVVAVESIGEQDIESFSNELFSYWGIGKKENDNGLLVLFVLDQRKIRFEVGYGLEGILPDALCKRIQAQYMLPAFRSGDYDTGLVQGIEQLCRIVENPDNREEVYASSPSGQDDWLTLIEMYLGLSLLFSIVLLLIIRPSRKGLNPNARYRELEMQLPTLKITAIIFPLFNLITYWLVRTRMHRIRNTGRICENCGQPMHKLDEEEDNKFLTSQENAEEIVQSVDYDVWLCDQCGATEVYAFPNKKSRYTECPHCHARTYALVSDRTLSPPTPFRTGMGEKRYRCRHCHYEKSIPYILPIIVAPIIGGGRRGGFGGGRGFGGGFGGGLSGGGGSTSGW